MCVRPDVSAVKAIIENYDGNREMLIPILHDIQAQYNYLPREALESVSKDMNIPMTDVFHVATFYRAFSLEPRGKHICKVCVGTACHIRGGRALVDEMSRVLDVEAGETTKDGEFTLETVSCVGACAMAPLVIIDGKYHGGVAPNQIKPLVEGCGTDENQ